MAQLKGHGRQGTREALLEAAVREFAQNGYHGTAVSAIVARCGLTKPCLYYHFTDKPGIYRALMDDAYDIVYERMTTALRREAGAEGQLVAMMQAFLDFAVERPEVFRLIMATLFSAAGEGPDQAVSPAKRRRNIGLIRSVIEEAVGSGLLTRAFPVDELVHSLLGAAVFRVIVFLTALDARWEPKAAAADLVRLFLAGARAPAPV